MNLKQTPQQPSRSKNDLLDEDIAESDDKEDIIDNESDDQLNDDFYSDSASPTNMQKYNDLLRELTNFNPVLKDTVNGWLGLTWNEEAEGYIRNPNIEPIMNIKGATWCVTYLKTYAKKTNLITHISEDEYKWLYWDINRVVWIDFATRDDFGVKNNQDFHRVGIEMVHAALLVITGAGGGKYNQFFGTATMRTEHVQVNGQGQPINNGMNMLQPPRRRLGVVGQVKKFLIGGN